MKIAATISLMLALTYGNAIGAETRSFFEGSWGGECGQGVQCWIDVEKSSDRFDVRVHVANALHAEKIFCLVKGKMKSAGADFIAGRLGHSKNSGLFKNADGTIKLHGASPEECKGRFFLEGDYAPIGD